MGSVRLIGQPEIQEISLSRGRCPMRDIGDGDFLPSSVTVTALQN